MKKEEKKVLRGKSKIKAVIFDVGGVLALGKNSKTIRKGDKRTLGVHQYIAKKLNVPLDQWLDSIDSVYADAIEGKISKEKTLKTISRNNHISMEKLEDLFKTAYKKHFEQNKQLFKQAFTLKQLGYKIAVLSDQWPVSKEALMPQRLYKQFDEVVVSCDVGARKPNPKIYKILLKKLKIPVKKCLFIDNQKWNLVPAKKLGFRIILFKDNKQLFSNPLWKRLKYEKQGIFSSLKLRKSSR